MKAKYLNPFTDFGFKKIFGEEASKPQLIDFLNSLLPERDQIVELTFKNNEQLGFTPYDRKAIYDIYCENQNGEKFIVELQKAKQNYFRERTIYYSTFPIREQAEKGIWNYNLKAVYCIGVLDFTFDDYESEPERSEVVHTINLKNQHGKVFYDKLTYIYLEMPNFKKEEHELATRLDKWLYFIKNLEDFQNIPELFKDEVFTQVAIPIEKDIQVKPPFSLKKMVLGKLLSVSVTGDAATVNNALLATKQYLGDKQRTSPAIPYVIYNTNRMKEPDAQKWKSTKMVSG